MTYFLHYPQTFKWSKCLTSNMFSETPRGQIKNVVIFALWFGMNWYGFALFLHVDVVWWTEVLQVEAIKMSRRVIRILLLSFFSHLILNPLGILLRYPEAVVRKCSVKRVFLNISQNTEENNCAGISFSTKLQANYCRKEIAAHVFLYKICEIFKNVFFKEHLRTIDSGYDVFSSNFLHIF